MKSQKQQTKQTPIRLHLELKGDYFGKYEKVLLKRYGESLTGDMITRDILIPVDMPLHNLHYAIQKLFGWRNSHLRRFYLPDSIYQQLTRGTVRGWSELVGHVFQTPSAAEVDIFWDDDYKSGNFNTWLKKKYTGPYVYRGKLEHLDIAQRDIAAMMDYYKLIDVRESFSAFMGRREQGGADSVRVLKKAPLIDLTLDEMHASLMVDSTDHLLERLEVNQVLAYEDEELEAEELFPLTNVLWYNYDFGDNWTVKITKHRNAKDLIKSNRIDATQWNEAIAIVESEHRPVCLDMQGVNVFDDVGGLQGFVDFLRLIYEEEDQEVAKSYRAWGKSQGWKPDKQSIWKVL